MSEVVIFHRDDHFYPIELLRPDECGKSLQDQACDHVKLNPGTTKVETIGGSILWPINERD